jgi:hydrogenase maturation protease
MDKYETILLIGLGNPILGDDGVGWRIVRNLEEALKSLDKSSSNLKVETEYLSLGGLSLMERMIGYQEVILVDSILTGMKPNGTIYSLPLSSLPNFSTGHSTAIHDTSLATAMEVGRKMGLDLPEEVWVVAVEAENVYEFSEVLSPPVEAAVPGAVDLLLTILKNGNRAEKICTPT